MKGQLKQAALDALRHGVRVLLIGIAVGVVAFAVGAARLRNLGRDWQAVGDPGSWRPILKTRILAHDGTLLTELFVENRDFTPLSALPRDMIDATLASEDRRFLEHIGISPRDMMRAVLANVARLRVSQGASTITQQIARDLYLTQTRTWRRKLDEIAIALQLERLYSKQELLEIYLNQSNYGRGRYGVATAAAMYFGRQPKDLTMAQCALLASIPRRPAAYTPYDDAAGALERRNGVLAAMAQAGYITSADARAAQGEALGVQPYQPPRYTIRTAPHFTRFAVRELLRLVGEERAYRDGLTVTTSLRLGLQATTDRAVAQAVANARQGGATEGAAVLLDVRNGQILAMCGGLQPDKSEFNRATQARRQPGSAFKPFVYATALASGLHPWDSIVDEPLDVELEPGSHWKPRNYDRTFHGRVTLTQALAQSINIPAVRLCQEFGAEAVCDTARGLGISTPLRPYLSIALGSSEVTVLDLTSAYGAIANLGSRAVPTALVSIKDRTGHEVIDTSAKLEAALDPGTAEQLIYMLRAVMSEGTGRSASFGVPHGGKTGTTTGSRDAWFVGFTPRFCAGVWLGDDANRPLRGATGGRSCGPAWRQIVSAAVRAAGQAPDWPPPTVPLKPESNEPRLTLDDDGLVEQVRVCRESGDLAGPHCPTTERTFSRGQGPRVVCSLSHAAEPPPMVDVPVPAPDDAVMDRPQPPHQTPLPGQIPGIWQPEEPVAPPAGRPQPKPAPEPASPPPADGGRTG